MKKIETKLAKNGSLPAGEKKKLRDELLELSYTAAGQMYTDTGGIKRSPAKKNKKTRSERLVEKEKSLKRKHTTAIAEGKEKKAKKIGAKRLRVQGREHKSFVREFKKGKH